MKKYNNTNIDQDELISVGSIGLLKSIKTYDTLKGHTFSTYAARCIQNEILMLIRSNKKYQNEISIEEKIGTDKDGNEMKTYIVPMTTTTGEQAVWDDVGSAEAFVRNCQDIAYETESKGTSGKNKYYGIRGLEDFRESAIIEDGVIFASPADKENFEKKQAQEYKIKGNVFIRSGK